MRTYLHLLTIVKVTKCFTVWHLRKVQIKLKNKCNYNKWLTCTHRASCKTMEGSRLQNYVTWFRCG